ncbi:MAG: hypothetical protein PHC61_05370 [Chitinivibrionales bacterium]|nr:hypothetical protein [Chitinivibrionales bacterium]
MLDFNAWYEQNYPHLTGQGLWLRGGELNTLGPAEYERRAFRICFARMSSPFDCAESLTHKLLYQIASNLPDVFCDLAYLPPLNDAPLFDRDFIPWILGTQTKRGPRDFDCIGFSNAIVQELLNLPTMLSKSGIPLSKKERLADRTVPLIILGGANAANTAWLNTNDPLVDGIFAGDSHPTLRRLLEYCRDAKNQNIDKSELLARLDSVEGFFQPDHIRPVTKARAHDLTTQTAPTNIPVMYIGDQAGRATIPISEGCPCFCSFCAESFQNKPYREISAGAVIEQVGKIKRFTGAADIDLFSFNFNMHEQIIPLLEQVSDIVNHIGLKSQRFDHIAHDNQWLRLLHIFEKTSLTCGLEGISARLRRYLNKNLTENDLHESFGRLLAGPLRQLKVFLIATGLEEEADYREFNELLDFIGGNNLQGEHAPRLIFSVTPLVRFPNTPLEHAPGVSPATYETILRKLQQTITGHGFEFRAAAGGAEAFVSQLLLRADRDDLRAAIVAALRETGFVYYRTIAGKFTNELMSRLKTLGIGVELAPTTGGFLSCGIEPQFLQKAYDHNRLFKEIDFCRGRIGKAGNCLACGACPDAKTRENLTAQKKQFHVSLDALKKRLLFSKENQAPINFWVALSEKARGVSRAYIGAALASALMHTENDLTDLYMGYNESFWELHRGTVWMQGDEGIALLWRAEAATTLSELLKDPRFIANVNNIFHDWGIFKGILEQPPEVREILLESPFTFNPAAYCTARGIKYTLKKTADGRRNYEITPAGLKKKIIRSLCETGSGGDCTKIALAPGEKFDVEPFVKESFVSSYPAEWMRTKITAQFKL